MNYKVIKIGLLNFWLYDEEEYEFSDGKLLLRGENGSGKSVTMQSFIPLILDGNKAPSRLDPFGSNDKHIEAYLLGGYDTEQKEEATGYLYMEVYNPNKNKYITIGMGLNAKKGRPVNFWGFALVDGRRINRDFWLYKNKHEKIPFSKQELKAALGNDNFLVESTKDYKKLVNNLIFGFPNLDQYDEFINVLLQLRSPKLSSQYKPTKLMGILSDVLQPLSESDLSSLTDAIEDMDKTKERNEQLRKDIKDVSYLKKSYSNYNEVILYKKAFNFLESVKTVNKYEEDIKSQDKEIVDVNKEIEELKNKIDEAEVLFESAKKEKENIDSKDIERATNRIIEINNSLDKIEFSNNKKNDEKKEYEEKRIDTDNKNKIIDDENYTYEKEIKEDISDITINSENVGIKEINVMFEDAFIEDKTIDFSYINSRVRKYLSILNNLKDKLKEKNDKEIKLGEEEVSRNYVSREYDKLLLKYENNEKEINDLLQDIKDQIKLLQSNNKYVKFNDNEKEKFLNYFKEYKLENYNSSRKLYENMALKYYNECYGEVCKFNEKINKCNDNLHEMNNILEELKLQKEDEIFIDEETKDTYKFLDENNISYVPFYKAIEFKDNVKDEVRDKLESILMNSGVLSALVIDKKNVNKVKNHKGVFLIESSYKKNNLTSYFKVSNVNFNSSIIEGVLKSISTNNEDLFSINDNEFKVDSMIGYGSVSDKSKFIGILAREEAQMRKVKEKEDQIKALEEKEQQLTILRDKKKDELEYINIEKEKFPSNLDIDKLNNDQNIVNNDMKSKQEELDRIDEKIKVINDEISNIFVSITELKKDVSITVSLENIISAVNDVNVMLGDLSNLERVYNKYKHNLSLKNINNERLDEIERSIDDILIFIHENEIEMAKLKKEKKSLEDLLNTDEYKDLSKKILELNEIINRIPKEKENNREMLGRQKDHLEKLKIERDKLSEEYDKKIKERDLKEKFFVNEYELGYVFNDEGESLIKAKSVVNKLNNRKDADISKIKESFANQYGEYRSKLQDYKLTIVSLFNEEVNEESNEFKEIYESAVRNDYRVVYQGKSMSLFALESELFSTISDNEEIMNEQDRNLFGEILLQSVGKKIREHIELSREWVDSINEIMKGMQQNSALSFHLEWRGKEGLSMEEVNTRELVRLFKIPSNMITEEDKAKLRGHFMSKLKREVDTLNDTHDSYTNIIFNILDYRNWFEFKLYYTRSGENRKELTDKIFSIFSGGEKAKSMYLPLFTAVVSKLKSARDDALRLVALDEAFAGVDEANIREMFGILSKLNLDYILTSQALWGDYDTINEMSICELLRPNNAQVVGVRRYHWDGHVRNYVSKEEEYETMEIF